MNERQSVEHEACSARGAVPSTSEGGPSCSVSGMSQTRAGLSPPKKKSVGLEA